MTGYLREPLLHFILIGAALFFIYSLTSDSTADDQNRIVIGEADVDRIISLWEMKWKRLPTETELQGLIEAHIREEVLYREALSMGLDKDDTIVRRRMAQKVEFISDNIAEQAEPSDEQLSAYLDANREKFEIPAEVSFRHVYLNVDQRGAAIEQDAERLMNQLGDGDGGDIENMGDPFMFGNRHDTLTRAGVARLFGSEFMEQLFSQQPGQWQGPLVSGYGLHLVHIESLIGASQPSLDSVRDRVRQEWSADERKRFNESFYEQLRSHYEVVIEPYPAQQLGKTAISVAGEG
ncbi:MAG: peptidyl-prolyl cis-trans isomerase [Gammaproteobacteria bacterium]|nr:peptidyl-prolyl cis-trans isomerase [Gammaproteobacteria bacterium]NNJ50713.1 peptidyl-prolyl cis-trans isomerase [Gammaproteobacteria bacterium]